MRSARFSKPDASRSCSELRPVERRRTVARRQQNECMAEPLVWALLVERGLDDGADLRLFWNLTDAHMAAWEYLADVWAGDGPLPADVDEALEQYNELPGNAEHVFVGQFPVEGERARCLICGEPIGLADETGSESWVHSEDANDGGDHTAEYSFKPMGPD